MRTALYERHRALGAKMITFAGWEMPVFYEGIIEEHKSVREGVGLFDVSHMGRISISGPDAEALLDYLSTNRIADQADGSATYTVWANEQGGSVDDLIVYRERGDLFFVVVNAANRQKDLAHLERYGALHAVTITPHFQGEGILALQGPLAMGLISEVFPGVEKLVPMHLCRQQFEGEELTISTTGYTGLGGVELCGSSGAILALWDRFIERGARPIGLGARDTLRLEKGYALYGHEIDETIAPTESVSAWTVKFEKGAFLGRESLLALEAEKRSEVGLLLEEGIARDGCPVFFEGCRVGRITSGTYSPTLERGIAIALIGRTLTEGSEVEVEVRKKRLSAKVVPFPFV